MSHRLHLIKAALKEGHDVAVLTRLSQHGALLESIGVQLYHWPIERRSLNLFSAVSSVLTLQKAIADFQPNLIHAVALKPVIYAGLARKLVLPTAFVAALGGVGFIFTARSLKAKILRKLISLILPIVLAGKQTRLILQNQDNIDLFEFLGICKAEKIDLVRGSGVEVEHFTKTPLPSGVPTVILPARLLWSKGVGEFANVANRIKKRGLTARFVLVGDNDPQNPASVSQIQIDKWVTQGLLEHWGRRDDMKYVFSLANIVCLPSYDEGLPKALLEGASCGRPLVAFDVPGCREIVRDNINGKLVKFCEEADLEAAILELIKNPTLCTKYGNAGRQIVKAEFSDKVINRQTFDVWDKVLTHVETKY